MSRKNQTTREELIRELARQLRYHSTATVFMHQAIAEKIELNRTDHKCLEIISRSGKLTAGELAEKSNLTTGAITGVIDRLEKAGYVRRIRDSADRRRLLLELIPENMGDIHDIFENLTESSVEFLSQYTDEELKIITGFIKHSTEFAANYAKQLRKAKDKQTKKGAGAQR
ncbi:MarR family transcriptional regulator [Bacillus sonorensis]|uniref:HTH-type transcriptional regulator YcgE n=2 Tax=Bacillus sonorensis TaxID=119858 RepID=M5PEQ3_9BACI|nr:MULTISPECIES: MarR family transcriptional regulator [Bacillus]TWK84427.1 HTH-type transcriptional regulator MhqR [Bacillus paralicheniformis]ASB88966.1 putative HTH-type transcriptional regulator YcgE [Bacillus sonorensis]EME75810.1 HTH-type transcriptional regulator YcgE [Bacillus sonorensis L12]MBG9914937.1 MarR family transcriptional regulator [Bacillus sonorensis]MCF7618315.1 MarR family transcriptional regulator [Bacillus sonorensis]